MTAENTPYLRQISFFALMAPPFSGNNGTDVQHGSEMRYSIEMPEATSTIYFSSYPRSIATTIHMSVWSPLMRSDRLSKLPSGESLAYLSIGKFRQFPIMVVKRRGDFGNLADGLGGRGKPRKLEVHERP